MSGGHRTAHMLLRSFATCQTRLANKSIIVHKETAAVLLPASFRLELADPEEPCLRVDVVALFATPRFAVVITPRNGMVSLRRVGR